MTSSPAPAAGQGVGTLKCHACGSANLEELCHEPPHPRFLCLDCNSGLNSEGLVIPAFDQADQGVLTVEDFKTWLYAQSDELHAQYFAGPPGESLIDEVARCAPATRELRNVNAALRLVRQFCQEREL